MYLSPYVEKPLNSKIIKSFVPELRSRKCFSCFEIPMFYVYIYMEIICPFRISVSGYGTESFKNLIYFSVYISIELLFFFFQFKNLTFKITKKIHQILVYLCRYKV